MSKWTSSSCCCKKWYEEKPDVEKAFKKLEEDRKMKLIDTCLRSLEMVKRFLEEIEPRMVEFIAIEPKKG